MEINEYFDHVYCINLDRRPDKWDICAAEFAKHRLDVERFSATWGHDLPRHATLMPGEVGCLKSHERVLRDMLSRKFERVLILEDDVEFVPNLQHRFSELEMLIPRTWDMLYFGGSHLNKPTPINWGVAKITKTYTTSSYAITAEMANIVLHGIEHAPQIDVLYSRFHLARACYTFSPALAWQRAGHSDIHNTHVDYTSFMKPKDL